MVLGLYRLYQIIGIILVGISILIGYGLLPDPIPKTPYTPRDLVIIQNVNVIPMDTERVIENQSVIVRDGHIAVIRNADEVLVPENSIVIDGTGQYLIPGLMDTNVRLDFWREFLTDSEIEAILLAYLSSGVTGIQVALGSERELEIKERVEIGNLLGPRMRVFTTAPILTAERIENDPHLYREDPFKTPRQARAAVREVAQAGFDGIDIVMYQPDHALAVIEQAAIEQLHSSVEFLTLDSSWTSDLLVNQLGTLDKMQILGGFELVGLMEDYQRDFDLIIEHWINDGAIFVTGSLGSQEINRLTDELLQDSKDLTLHLDELGATFILGSLHGYDNVWNIDIRTQPELEALTDIGFSPYEALRAATANISENISYFNDAGVIETGKRADLVLLEGNPLEDITNTQKIVGIVVNGNWWSTEALEQKKEMLQAEE